MLNVLSRNICPLVCIILSAAAYITFLPCVFTDVGSIRNLYSTQDLYEAVVALRDPDYSINRSGVLILFFVAFVHEERA